MQKNLTGPKAVVWSQPGCAHCNSAKSFLEIRGYTVEVRTLENGGWTITDLHKDFPQARTVPQITVDGENVGDFNALRGFFDKV